MPKQRVTILATRCRARARTLAIALPALLLCVAGLAGGQEAKPEEPNKWWESAWRFRKLISVPEKGADAYRLWILTGDRAKPDGADIRVVGPARVPVPFSIFHSTPEGRHLLAFAPGGGGGTSQYSGVPYAVYYGNPKATAQGRGGPRIGLVLETRAVPEDADVSTTQAARRTLQNAKKLYGRDFTGRIFMAHNPFGPQADYASVYGGYVRCPAKGVYRFATLSDDASFLEVNGKLVAEWPGRGHGINTGRYGEHSTAIRLNAGTHRIRYVAFSFGGAKRHAAAWSPPGAKKGHYQIIPPAAFGQLTPARILETHQFRRPACADFSSAQMNYLEVAGARMVAVQFTSHSSAPKDAVRSYAWDFGDGQTDPMPKPVHVFLAPGVYTVTLTVTTHRGAKDSFTVPVTVCPIWTDLDFERWKKDQFLAWVKAYDVPKLPTTHLLALRDLMNDSEKRKNAFEACVELDKRRDELEKLQLYEVAMDLGDYHLDPLGKWKPAADYYRLAMAQLAEDDTKRFFNVRFHMADLHFYYARDYVRAQLAYEGLRRDFPYEDPIRRRVALIRLGDIQRDQGKLEDARAIYAEAEADPKYAPQTPPSIAEGRFRQETESFLVRGEGKRGLESVEQWLWVFPTRRLDGETLLLRIKANMLLNQYQEARKQADTYISFADELDNLPYVHVLAGEACLELGDLKPAREHWQMVLERWPESPAVTEARNGLLRLDKAGG